MTESPKRGAYERIRDLGLKPRTVIDVGVATGTPDLWGAFPDVRYLLIEPLEESAPFMQKLVDAHPGSAFVLAAAGREAGRGNIIVNSGLSGSSFRLKSETGQKRKVPIVTVDETVAGHGFEGPYVLKIDVQGFELEVLAGAEQVLKDTALLITEASLWADTKGGRLPRLTELMGWLEARGFVLYDIAQIVRRRLDGAITEMDLIFCPASSPLRQVTSYKTQSDGKQIMAKRRRNFGLS